MITIENIVNTPCETTLPKDWGGYRMLYVRTPAGDIDVLCGPEGEPVTQRTEPVIRIEHYFGKRFQPAMVAGTECLVNIINEHSYELER